MTDAKTSPESVVFDRAAGFYDETRGFPPGEEKAIAALMARAGDLKPTSRVLEVGIGTGRISLPLAAHVNAVYGVDLSRPMMARLREKQRSERIGLAEADAVRLPFPDKTFDAVLAVHVFHLIPAWQAALREVARVLRPGAPMIRSGGGDHHSWSALWDAWRVAVPGSERSQNVGLAHDKTETFLEDEGWRPLMEPYEHKYVVMQSPQLFLERLEQRAWSSLWRLTDEELARGVAAVRAAIDSLYDDPRRSLEIQARFVVRTYLPPVEAT